MLNISKLSWTIKKKIIVKSKKLINQIMVVIKINIKDK